MNREFTDIEKLAVKLARLDEIRKIRAALMELDKGYDIDYLRCCDAGSNLGAAQAAGRRMAVTDLKRILEVREQEAKS